MSHPLRGTFVGNSIVRLADEGVPIGVLSRVFKIPHASVHDVVQQALTDGIVVGMPAPDWPPESKRGLRSPTTALFKLPERPGFLFACRMAFGMTVSEATILQCLMQLQACTRSHLLDVVSPEAKPEIIDVFICKIRAKLKPFDIAIQTIWGQGYLLPEKSKRQVLARIEVRK